MKRHSWLAAVLLPLVAWPVVVAEDSYKATVTRDRVNARGQPTLSSEVITQLRQGESVTVLGEVKLTKPKAGEPAEWARIQMPQNTPVWVSALFVDATNKTVKVKRLNLRAGPGENFSVVGTLERDAPVSDIRVVDDWMEIETPTNAFAFVALEMLAPQPSIALDAAPESAPLPALPDVVEPPPAAIDAHVEPRPETGPETAAAAPPPAPAPAPVATPPPTPANEPPPAAEKAVLIQQETKAAEPPPAPVVKEGTPAITEPTPTPPPVASEPKRKRMVRREGIVKSTLSIQAPTPFELANAENGRIMNFLHPLSPEQKLKAYKGRRVIVTGEELIDPRWPKTPVIDLETIDLAP